MLSFATILSVVLLVRCKEIDRSHSFRAHIKQLKVVVSDLVVDVVEDSTELISSDLKYLKKFAVENKIYGKKPKLSEDEKPVVLGEKLEKTQNTVIVLVLEAVKHCRGDKDKILGKLLGFRESKKSKRSAGKNCLTDNPHKAELLETLEDFEEELLKSFEQVRNNHIEKLDLLFDGQDDFGEEAFQEETAIRKLSGKRTEKAVGTIEKIIKFIIHDAEAIDSKGKNLDELAEKINDVIYSQDIAGSKKAENSIKKAVRQTEKLYQDIEKVVTQKHE